VKMTMAKTLSRAEPARTKVGMPFLAPLPCSMKEIIMGTTTAGDTALRWPQHGSCSQEKSSR